MGNRLALLDPFYEQTTTMNSETGITVRHEDLLVCEAATPQCPEVFTISEICHQRPGQVQLAPGCLAS